MEHRLRPSGITKIKVDVLNVRMTATVVNRRNDKSETVYIGRPSIWGNPFKVGADGTQEEVVSKYKEWVLKHPRLLKRLPELANQRLGCWCKPLPCHGDVLVELLGKLR